MKTLAAKIERMIDKSTYCNWGRESRNKIIIQYDGKELILEKRIQSFDVVLEVTIQGYQIITGLPFDTAYKQVWKRAEEKVFDHRSAVRLVGKALACKVLDDIK